MAMRLYGGNAPIKWQFVVTEEKRQYVKTASQPTLGY